MRLIDAEKLTEVLENTFCAGCEHYDHAKCRACTIDDVFDVCACDKNRGCERLKSIGVNRTNGFKV